MNNYFVNELFDSAIKQYIDSKSYPDGKVYNSFLVVLIRILCSIYEELDLLNPYHTNDMEMLYTNLKRYGANDKKINEFFELLELYNYIEEKNKKNNLKVNNEYFIEIQKNLIDLFIYKKKSIKLTNEDYKEFFDLLYTPATSNPLRQSFNYLNASDIYEIAKYYQDRINESEEMIITEKKELLNMDVYKLFNYKISDISKMNNEQIKDLNKNIYASLNINENAINKDYLIDEFVNSYKYNENNKITTGNGYVDILLVMSIIITCVMIISIFALIII